MKVTYDQEVDAPMIILKQRSRVGESDELRPGVIVDYDGSGNIVSIEVLNASNVIPDVTTIAVFSVLDDM